MFETSFLSSYELQKPKLIFIASKKCKTKYYKKGILEPNRSFKKFKLCFWWVSQKQTEKYKIIFI